MVSALLAEPQEEDGAVVQKSKNRQNRRIRYPLSHRLSGALPCNPTASRDFPL